MWYAISEYEGYNINQIIIRGGVQVVHPFFILLRAIQCFAKTILSVFEYNYHGIVIASYGCNKEENHLTIFRMH